MQRLLSTVAAISFATAAHANPFYVGSWGSSGVPCEIDPWSINISTEYYFAADATCKIIDITPSDRIQVIVNAECEDFSLSLVLDYRDETTMVVTNAYRAEEPVIYRRCDTQMAPTREH